jgi:hypothetical protein
VTTVTSTRAGRRLGAAATLVLALAFAPGCGGDDAGANDDCVRQARNAAEAAAVADLYERGELGSKEEIQADLDQEGMEFFDGDRMIPYEELSQDEQNQLVAWFSNGPISEETEQERERAAAEVDPDC